MAVDVSASPDTVFAHWLPRYLDLRLAKRREHGRWFVLIEDFDITGVGSSSDDALDEAFSLLEAYLRAHFEDGASFDHARRPIPKRMKVAIRAGTMLNRLWPEDKRAAERRTLVSPSTLLRTVC